MGTPADSLPRVQRNKRTGAIRVSYDGGASWKAVALPPAGDEPEAEHNAAEEAAEPPSASPAPRPAPVATPAPAQSQPTYSALEKLAAGLSASDPFNAARERIGRVLSWETGDEATGAVVGALPPAMLGDHTGIPREYASGSAMIDATNSRRDDLDRMARENPVGDAAGFATGMAPYLLSPMSASGGIATTMEQAAPKLVTSLSESAPAVSRMAHAELASTLANAGRVAGRTIEHGIIGGGTAALQRAGDSRADTVGGRLADAAEAIPGGVAFGSAVGTGFDAIGAAGRALAPGLAEKAGTWRFAATGPYAGASRRMLEREGYDMSRIAQVGDDVERLGLHKRPASDGWKRILPAGPDTYLENARRVTESTGRQVGRHLDDAVEQGVMRPSEEVIAEQIGAVAALPRKTIHNVNAQRTAAKNIRQFEADTGDMINPRDLWEQKRGLDKQVYGPLTVKGDTPRIDALQTLADKSRGQMYDMMDEMAMDETAQGFRSAMNDHTLARTVQTLAAPRVGQELGNHLISLPSATAAAPGAESGGIPGAILSMLGMGSIKKYGKDFGANQLRRMQHAAEFVGQHGARGADSATEIGSRISTPRGGSPTAAFEPAAVHAQDGGETDQVLQAIAADPNAFGPTTQLIQQLAQSGDVSRMRLAIMASQRGARR